MLSALGGLRSGVTSVSAQQDRSSRISSSSSSRNLAVLTPSVRVSSALALIRSGRGISAQRSVANAQSSYVCLPSCLLFAKPQPLAGSLHVGSSARPWASSSSLELAGALARPSIEYAGPRVGLGWRRRPAERQEETAPRHRQVWFGLVSLGRCTCALPHCENPASGGDRRATLRNPEAANCTGTQPLAWNRRATPLLRSPRLVRTVCCRTGYAEETTIPCKKSKSVDSLTAILLLL